MRLIKYCEGVDGHIGPCVFRCTGSIGRKVVVVYGWGLEIEDRNAVVELGAWEGDLNQAQNYVEL